MGTTAPQADAGAEGSPNADDLKRIPGIGPVIERHLREAGIYTFAQLAALSPEQIAALLPQLPLLSLERIVRQDWVGRARDLAREAERDPASGERAAPGLRAVAFTVDLLLDAHGRVVQTRAVHLPDGAKEVWDGWAPDGLVSFFGDFVAGLAPAPTGARTPMEHLSPERSAELWLELGELLVEAGYEGEPDGAAAGGELQARLPFALAGPAAAQLAAAEAPYYVAILAADQAGGAPLMVGAHHGRLRPGQRSYGPPIPLSPPEAGRFQLLGTVVVVQAGLVQSVLGPVLHVVA